MIKNDGPIFSAFVVFPFSSKLLKLTQQRSLHVLILAFKIQKY